MRRRSPPQRPPERLDPGAFRVAPGVVDLAEAGQKVELTRPGESVAGVLSLRESSSGFAVSATRFARAPDSSWPPTH